MALGELRPRGVGEVLDAAFRVCRGNYRALMQTVAVIVVPVQVFLAVIDVATLSGTNSSSASRADSVSVISSLLIAAAAQLASAACLRAVAGATLGRSVSWQESLEFAWSRFRSVLWIAVLTYGLLVVMLLVLLLPVIFKIVSGGAFFLLAIPGFYLWVCWLVALPALLVEGTKGIAALTRSRHLVAGRWWPTFGTYLAAAILIGFVTALISGVLLAAAGGSHASEAMKVFVTALAGSIGGILTTPFSASVIALIYIDLRVRKEGLDVPTLAREVRVDLPEEPPQQASAW